tara:strand:- start:558 stop:881 length:324 start_codon:yes stop_codon:yes gene_type:complete
MSNNNVVNPEVLVRMNEQLDFLSANPGMEMPMTSSLYDEQQEFRRFEGIMNTQEYLTQEEYDFCFAYDKSVREDTTFIGLSEGNTYLNLNVYSEHDHEKRGNDLMEY